MKTAGGLVWILLYENNWFCSQNVTKYGPNMCESHNPQTQFGCYIRHINSTTNYYLASRLSQTRKVSYFHCLISILLIHSWWNFSKISNLTCCFHLYVAIAQIISFNCPCSFLCYCDTCDDVWLVTSYSMQNIDKVSCFWCDAIALICQSFCTLLAPTEGATLKLQLTYTLEKWHFC
jgi:hypothetical protein